MRHTLNGISAIPNSSPVPTEHRSRRGRPVPCPTWAERQATANDLVTTATSENSGGMPHVAAGSVTDSHQSCLPHASHRVVEQAGVGSQSSVFPFVDCKVRGHSVPLLERLVIAVEAIAASQKRIADHFDPPPPDIVGTDYISARLGCTAIWVTDMARNGQIPKSCVVQGTGNGKPWRFHRHRIDEWLAKR